MELGGRGRKSAAYTCISSTPGIVGENATLVYGPDLGQIKGPLSYARITFAETEDIGEDDRAYHICKDIDLIKYSVFPERFYGEGFLHGSAGAGAGRKKGCEGWTVLCADRKSVYQKLFGIPGVKAVQVLFITGETADFKGLDDLQRKIK